MILNLIKAGSSTGYKFSLLDYILCTIFCFMDISKKQFSYGDVVAACEECSSKPVVATYSVIKDAARTIARARVLEHLLVCPNCNLHQDTNIRKVINGTIPGNCPKCS